MLSVITPATSQRLTTVAAVRRDLVTISGLVTDDIVTGLIDQVSSAIASWCGRDFGVQTVAERLHHCGPNPRLILSLWPILSVASVVLDGTAADPATYRVETNGFLSITGQSAWRFREAVITYTAGYVLPDDTSGTRTLPADVERAAIIAIKEACFAVGRDPALKSDEVGGVGSVQYVVGGMTPGSGLRPDVEGLLNRYRVPVIG